MGEEYGEEHPFLFFCSFSDADLVESVRTGRRQEFEAFHAHGEEVPDPQAEATFEASRLTWFWEDAPHKAGLRRLYQDLLAARRGWPALHNVTQCAARLQPGVTPDALLELLRGGRHPTPGETLRVYFNLTGEPQPFAPPAAEYWLFSSEARRYHGGRHEAVPLDHLLPYECVAFGPASWDKYL